MPHDNSTNLSKFYYKIIYYKIIIDNDNPNIIVKKESSVKLCNLTIKIFYQDNIIQIEKININGFLKPDLGNNNRIELTPNASNKETMNKFGEFVSDLYSPDIAIMNFDATQIYKILLPMFKTRQVTWSGVQESNPHS